MTTELHELKALLIQALHRLDQLIDIPPDPRLPILTAWLNQYGHGPAMLATQLYVHLQVELKHAGHPVPNQRQVADMLKQLGYTKAKTSSGMTWSRP